MDGLNADIFSLFASLVTALVLEAMPFLALGALISGLVEVFAPADLARRRLPKSPAGQLLLGLFAGMVLPTCECGSVPIVRRFLQKGVPARTAITYLLAAPVVNPVVLASTWTAFKGDWSMVLARVFLVALPAVVAGLALGRARPQELLRFSLPMSPAAAQATHGHDHGHGPGCACGCDHGPAPGKSRIMAVLAIAANEFMEASAFLILGGCAAALFKVLTPASAVAAFAGNLPLSVAALMLLAIALTVCSEADSFVAASFTAFPDAAKAAFIAIGPMVDLKLIALYLLVFRRRVAGSLVLAPVVMVYALSLALGGFGFLGGGRP